MHSQPLTGEDIKRFFKPRSQVLHQEYLSGNLTEMELSAVQVNDDSMVREYLKHILKTGSADDRQQILGMIKSKFILSNRRLTIK